ncbi:MAG: hypothetical protein LBM66_02385 [Bifidobacteriaceae bacterium]|nr:hypothetical protein [Bifidobacteriaceae bacterium]
MPEASANQSPDDAAEFDRRWQELAEQLEAEMGAAGPSITEGAGPRPSADGPSVSAPPPDGPLPPPWKGRLAPVQGPAPTPDHDGEGDTWDPTGWADVAGGPASPPGPRDWEAAADPADEHFIPPEPPPVLDSEPLKVVAWAAIAAGLIGLALYFVLHLDWNVWVPRGLALLAAAGIGTLLWRMPRDRENPDDPGARV